MEELLSFGDAIKALKEGRSVARQGWNGKGMCVYMNKGSIDRTHDLTPGSINGVRSDLFESGDQGTITRNPYLVMVSAQKTLIPGWLASQTDILADDWTIVAVEENAEPVADVSGEAN